MSKTLPGEICAVVVPTSASSRLLTGLLRRLEMTGRNLNRREFLKLLGATSTSLIFGIYLSGCDQTLSPSGQTNSEPTSTPLPTGLLEPNIYLKIESSGKTTVTAFRSEMGQGIRTAIAMILAGMDISLRVNRRGYPVPTMVSWWEPANSGTCVR